MVEITIGIILYVAIGTFLIWGTTDPDWWIKPVMFFFWLPIIIIISFGPIIDCYQAWRDSE
jgi:hypothetical protein